jgi:hypothetical protein
MKRLEQRAIPGGHRHAEHESLADRAVDNEAFRLLGDAERALTGDDTTEYEPEPIHVGVGGASRNRTGGLVHAMHTLYQLSYSPVRLLDVTSAQSLLKPLADHTHASILTAGCQGPSRRDEVSSDTSATSGPPRRHNDGVNVLLGTERGLLSLDGGREGPFAGEPITGISGQWVLIGERTLASLATGAEAKLEGPSAWCLIDAGERLYVGTARARLFAGPSTSAELAPVESFDRIPTREEWYTPWGEPPDTRSLAAGAAGVLVNVHVGGVWLQFADDGWEEVVSVDADTHQVVADVDQGVAAAAAAIGFGRSLDGGATWDWTADGLHASYCRAVAIAGDTALVTASNGPGTRQGAVYRRPLRGDGPFAKAHTGLPEWFPFNLNTFQLAAAGDEVVLGTDDGRVYRSSDAGTSWELAADGLPPVRAVAVQ